MGNGEIESEGEGEEKGEGEGDEMGGGFSHEVSLIELSGGLAARDDDNIPVGAELDDLVLQRTSCGEELTLSFGAMP